MKPKPLVAFDFDRTVADTYTPSPTGIGVNQAYDNAVRTIFGEGGFSFYHDVLGGLKEREPKELTRELLQGLQGSPPEPETLRSATTSLVSIKLEAYRSIIGKEWPRLYPGATDFFKGVEEGILPIDIAIVSSGHDEFINEVFKANDLMPPPIMITSDTIRDLNQPNRDLQKPYPYQLARAHYDWAKQYGESPYKQNGSFTGREKGKPYILYVGDDLQKDGRLAYGSRIPFGYVPFSGQTVLLDSNKGQFLVPDFYYLFDVLKGNRSALLEGASFSEILFQKKDAELFPPLPENERPYAKWLESARVSPSGKERF